jgi:hypothetical protein
VIAAALEKLAAAPESTRLDAQALVVLKALAQQIQAPFDVQPCLSHLEILFLCGSAQ